MSNQDDVIKLIKSISGQANVLTIPRVYIRFTKSHRAALFLSQCVYWSDRSSEEEGWFYKCFKDWREELGLNQHAVETCVKTLKGGGWLETKVEIIGTRLTTLYRPDLNKIAESVQSTLAETANVTTLAETAKVHKRKTIMSSIKQKLPQETTHTSGAGEHPQAISDLIMAALHQTYNGELDLINPRIHAIDEARRSITIAVSQKNESVCTVVRKAARAASGKAWSVRVEVNPPVVGGETLTPLQRQINALTSKYDQLAGSRQYFDGPDRDAFRFMAEQGVDSDWLDATYKFISTWAKFRITPVLLAKYYNDPKVKRHDTTGKSDPATNNGASGAGSAEDRARAVAALIRAGQQSAG